MPTTKPNCKYVFDLLSPLGIFLNTDISNEFKMKNAAEQFWSCGLL